MAEKTPSSVVPIHLGNKNGYVATFTDIDDTDTFVTANSATPLYWGITNTTDGVVISATFSSGTFTFAVASGGTNKAAQMLVLF